MKKKIILLVSALVIAVVLLGCLQALLVPKYMVGKHKEGAQSPNTMTMPAITTLFSSVTARFTKTSLPLPCGKNTASPPTSGAVPNS